MLFPLKFRGENGVAILAILSTHLMVRCSSVTRTWGTGSAYLAAVAALGSFWGISLPAEAPKCLDPCR